MFIVSYQCVDFESITLTPNANVENGVLTLAEGTDIQVVGYTIVANPPPTIELTRADGGPVIEERLQVTNGALMIVGVSRVDAGMYDLTFSHPQNTTIFQFTLEVECKPPNITLY